MSKRTKRDFPGVYAITNTITGVAYIGQTNNMRVRWSSHRRDLNNGSHRNCYLLHAWKKYGADAFVFSVLHNMADLPSEELAQALNAAEIHELSLRPKAYNLMEAGFSGMLASPETKELLSTQRLALWSDPDFRAKQTAILRSVHRDPEYTKRRMNAVHEGKRTPESRAKVSEEAKKRWADPEFRARMSAKKLLQWQDPAYREQQSKSRAKSWADPQSRERRMAGLMRAAADPAVLEARKAGRKKKSA